MVIEGVIIRGIGGFYYVKCEKDVYECRARGIFRKDGISPMVGDRVVIRPGEGSGYVLHSVLPRKNALVRPAVANIDALLILLSADKPKPDFLLCDKLIVSCLANDIQPVICITKSDRDRKGAGTDILGMYGEFKSFYVSALRNDGIPELKSFLSGRVTAFAGQSAVGKSSLLNTVCPGLGMETGELSKKTARGKHTTRHSELVFVPDINGYIIDTPGFSVFDALDMEAEALKNYYPEFYKYTGKCRFASCMHIDEPECEVKLEVENGNISRDRYERYKVLTALLKEKGEKKYD